MALAPLDELMLAKFRAFPGVTPGQSYDATFREYFIIRSGAASDPETPLSFYMHLLFDNLALPECSADCRFRYLFILESAATDAMSWADAARIWASS